MMPAVYPVDRAPSASPKRLAAGFTLIELMVTVAIIGILSAIAYPAYTASIVKGKRGEGRAGLADLMQQQERYMTQTGCYGVRGSSGACAEVSLGQTGVPFKTFSGNALATSAYKLGVRACTFTPAPALADCGEVYAEPIPVTADPKANVLWMRSTGQKGCNGSDPSICWK